MTEARYVVADVRDALVAMPDDSVDLIFGSPPFLALRSYLPPDHPDKWREIGSEPDPATFIDTLLGLTAEWGRVLAPHGSIVIELGDTYSGSTADGGDNRGTTRYPLGRSFVHGARDRTQGWPLSKSLCGIPWLYTLSLTYGRNLLTGQSSPAGQWIVRNVIAWCRPNPPVGALGDKFRPATSFLTVATRSSRRWFDLDAVRQPARIQMGRAVDGNNIKGSDAGSFRFAERIDSNPAGVPPLDYWEIPTEPCKLAHYATFPRALCERPIKSMCPAYVCLDCGSALGSIHEEPTTQALRDVAGYVLPGMRQADYQSLGSQEHQVLLESVRQQEHGPQSGFNHRAHSDLKGLHHASQAGASDGGQRGLCDGAPSGDGREAWQSDRAGGRGSPHQWDQRRQPAREPDTAGEGTARSLPEESKADRVSLLRARRASDGSGTSSCGRCNSTRLRTGRVLDPFAGTGTTLAVATGHGRDAIGVDIDRRNYDLATDRVGPLFLTEATIEEAALWLKGAQL